MDTKIRKFGVAILVVVSLVVSAVQVGTVQGQSPVIVASSTNGRIAFASNRDGNYEIYVMNADGTSQTRLTDFPTDCYLPSWSPDGSRIAFLVEHLVYYGVYNYEIYVVNADGSGQARVTNLRANGYLPSWSSEGGKIVFGSGEDPFEIYVVNTDGSGQVRLTDNSVPDRNPSWSPLGNKIVFECAFVSGGDWHWDICVMGANGSGWTNLTDDLPWDGYPVWSSDGTKIAFESNRDSNGEIYVLNTDGSGQTRLTNNPKSDTDPAWSQDGNKIAFTSDRDGNYEIYVVNTDGSGVTRLTNSLANDWMPDWGHGEVIPTPTPAPTTQPTVQPTPTLTPQPTPQPTATTTPQPTSTPSAGDIHLDVQPLRQDDKKEPWAGDIYNLYTPDKVLDTIARWGCATTSAAMVLNYYGKSSGMQTDPKELDDWLAASSSYTPEHGVIWSRVTWFAWDKMGLTLAQPVYVGVTVSRLDNALAQGIPPIVNVGGHFVVVTGKVGGKYTINDPLTNGHETLDQYQFWGSMIAYASASGPTAPSLWLYLCSPAEMVVMDSLGRQTGIDPTTGDEFSEIPGAFYGDEFLSPADDSDGATMHAKVLVLPEGGIYTVEVTGTGEGSYTLLAISSGDGGQPFSQSITRSVSSGQVDSYVLDYSPADGSLELTQNTYLPLVLR